MTTDIALFDVWGQVLSSMEPEVMKPSFESWLRGSHPVGFFDNTLVVAVPNTFALEWIEGRYLSMIRTLLQGIVGHEVGVKFVIPPSEAADAGPPAARPDARGRARTETAGGAATRAPVASGNASTSPRLVKPASTRPSTSDAPPQAPQLSASPSDSRPEDDSLALEFGSRRPFAAYLNPKYTFESFVVGNSNRFAHAASQKVAESPAKAYNPLFLYGGSGLGKTHLMQAIGHQVARNFPRAKVLYVTAETFTNELINAIRDDLTREFKNRYRNIDVLLIDDIQFIAGKERTEEEFFHTFEALHGANRQIVMSSDRPPREIRTLEERLRSRFEGGLLADIQPPDLETRVAILRKKALRENLIVPDDVFMYIANAIRTNIRELEGALIRIVASASLQGVPVDLALTMEAMKDILPNKSTRAVTLLDIQKAVAKHFSLSLDDLKNESRARKVALPRQVAMYLCRELTNASLPRIGQEFGGRDHTTVLHACEKISSQRQTDPDLEQAISSLLALLQNPG